MTAIDEQVRGKFKMFSGQLDADGSIAGLAARAAAWVRDAKVAPKSIGVEYLEGRRHVLLTIGYRDDEPGYAVQLTSVPIGRIGALDDADVTRLEHEMQRACAHLQRIICHELYVTETGDLSMVFMTQQA